MATVVLSPTPSLAIVTNLVAAHLTIRAEDLDPDRPLALYGLDSVSAMELLAATEDAIGRTLPACLFVDHPTLRTVAATIDGAADAAASGIAFEDEARLPEDIRIPALPIIHPAKTVLLTGATGFLGAHVLRALADHTTATICCFVRADTGQGLTRVRANLERYGLWRSGLADRLEMVRGDLARPGLGLGADEYDGLADIVDAIYHVAADVNWVQSYAALRDVNVGGTLSLIRLAAEARPKAFHFVSSLSVGYVPGDSSLVVDETTDVLPYASRLPLGYAQTKAVAESLLRQAGARGLPVHVTRPGLIAGDSATGSSNIDDLIARVIKGSIAMGRAPDLQWQFEAVPVDHVARAIVRAGATAPGFRVTHIAPDRPRTWQECVLWLNARGYACTLEPFESWRSKLASDATTVDHPLHGLRPFFAPREAAERSAAELYQADAHARVNSDDSRATAAARCESWPSVDAPMLGRIVDDYVRRGWLPEAPGRVRLSYSDRDRPAPAWRQVAGVERMLQNHFNDPALHVTALAEVSTGSAHSIVSELTSWQTGAPVGLFGLRAQIARGGSESTLDVLIKAKPSDTEAIDVACHLARMCSEPLGEAVSSFRDDLDLLHGHHREPGIYRDADETLRSFLPRAYGCWCDDDARQWGVALERITNASLIDAVDDPARWTPAHLETSIDGLAVMHAAGMTAIDRWRAKPWLRARRSARDMTAMTPLWSALADHAGLAFGWWSHDSVLARHQRLVTTIDQWWPALDAIPETLAHNDCNPRNLVIRNVTGGTRLCAFDWELATLAAPQRDLAEWLCFVLPPDVDAATARALVDRHRGAMVRAGADIARIGDASLASGDACRARACADRSTGLLRLDPARSATAMAATGRRDVGPPGGCAVMRAPVHDLHPSHLLTYASLACGVLAIAAAHGQSAAAPHLAGAFVAAAALSDTLDGRFARRFPRTPRDAAIGGHLDSLVDACVFGIAPIAILAAVAPPPEGFLFTAWWLAAVVYGVCAVTRLASFNVTDDARTFAGVPTPAAALVWSTVLAAGPTPAVTMSVFLALGLAMVMPVAIPRPRGAALMLFGAWAVGLVGWHLRGL